MYVAKITLNHRGGKPECHLKFDVYMPFTSFYHSCFANRNALKLPRVAEVHFVQLILRHPVNTFENLLDTWHNAVRTFRFISGNFAESTSNNRLVIA